MVDFFETLSRFLRGELCGERIFGGSRRRFYRIQFGAESYIIMRDDDATEASRYARLLANLRRRGVPVPEVYAVDESAGALVMEDVGTVSLYDWFTRTGDAQPYFRAVRALCRIHALGDVPGQVVTEFDVPDLMFETQYFARHLLMGYCGFPPGAVDQLLDEFAALAEAAATSPKGLMHRDFQSQNIFVVPGGVRVIDFQGARRGLRAYDIASLLEDPYVRLPQQLKRALLNEYFTHSELAPHEQRRFVNSYPYAALQRLLQAAAAFAYLSRVEGKWWFERFIPSALARAKALSQYLGEFPAILGVLSEAESLLAKGPLR